MTDYEIVYPAPHAISRTLHLFTPNYKPGRKARSTMYDSALCGAPASLFVGHLHDSPTGRVRIPLSLEHIENLSLIPGEDYPRAPGYWKWCALCIGRAVEREGIQSFVMGFVFDRRRVAAHD